MSIAGLAGTGRRKRDWRSAVFWELQCCAVACGLPTVKWDIDSGLRNRLWWDDTVVVGLKNSAKGRCRGRLVWSGLAHARTHAR